MAKEHQSDKGIDELREEIARSRDRLALDLSGLRHELDIPGKLRRSFQQHAGLWISAAVLTGVVVVARAIPTRKVTYVSSGKGMPAEAKKGLLTAGVAMGVLKVATVILRPMLVKFATQKLGSYAAGAFSRRR